MINADGQITDSVIDTLEFDEFKGKTPNIIPISGNVFAIAYAGDGDVGLLKTIVIDTTGQITDTVADTLEFGTLQGLSIALPEGVSISIEIKFPPTDYYFPGATGTPSITNVVQEIEVTAIAKGGATTSLSFYKITGP